MKSKSSSQFQLSHKLKNSCYTEYLIKYKSGKDFFNKLLFKKRAFSKAITLE